MNQTLSVTAIETGCVIDHIPPGSAIKMIALLKLTHGTAPVTVGFNLASKRLGHKDIIKLERRMLTEVERLQIGIFAPGATVNEISGHKVIQKHQLVLPKQVEQGFVCANSHCITNQERVKTKFRVLTENRRIYLQCHYCEQTFAQHLLEG